MKYLNQLRISLSHSPFSPPIICMHGNIVTFFPPLPIPFPFNYFQHISIDTHCIALHKEKSNLLIPFRRPGPCHHHDKLGPHSSQAITPSSIPHHRPQHHIEESSAPSVQARPPPIPAHHLPALP